MVLYYCFTRKDMPVVICLTKSSQMTDWNVHCSGSVFKSRNALGVKKKRQPAERFTAASTRGPFDHSVEHFDGLHVNNCLLMNYKSFCRCLLLGLIRG